MRVKTDYFVLFWREGEGERKKGSCSQRHGLAPLLTLLPALASALALGALLRLSSTIFQFRRYNYFSSAPWHYRSWSQRR